MLTLTKNIFSYILLISSLSALNLTFHDYDNPSASHILDAEIIDDILIVTGMVGGIEFYDISNPTILNHLTSFNLSSGGGGGGGGGSKPNCVKASGNYAYVTTKNGVAILNISNPSNPQSLGYISGTSNMILENLDIYNDILAVAAHEDGVLFYDISNPSNPQSIETIQTENSWTVYMENSIIFIGDESQLVLYHLNESNNNIDYMATLDMPNSIKDIVGDGFGLLYVALGTDGVMALNTATDVTPYIIDIYNTTALANRLAMLGDKVAVSDWDDVEILQLNNNMILEKIGYKNTTRRTMGIATKGNYIYSAEWASVQIFEYGQVNGPDIDLSAYELNYPYVENGDSYTLSLEIINNGTQLLDINNTFLANSEFSPSFSNGDVNPGETQTVDITYTANAANASSSYKIYSNDMDESEVLCEVNGNIIGANIGDDAPDFDLNIVANGNGSFKLSDHIGEVIVLAFFAPN